MPGDQPESGNDHVFVWEPGRLIPIMWVALAILLGLLTLMSLGMVYSLVGAGASGDVLPFNWVAISVLTVFVLASHPMIHALIARILGANPRFDFDVIQWLIPAMYCRPGDHHFPRIQFLFYSLAPIGILSAIGFALMPIDSRSAWLIIPIALNASLSIPDIWRAWIVWGLPAGSEICVERGGLRLFLPG